MLFLFEKSGSSDLGAKIAGGDAHNVLQCSSAFADTACIASTRESRPDRRRLDFTPSEEAVNDLFDVGRAREEVRRGASPPQVLARDVQDVAIAEDHGPARGRTYRIRSLCPGSRCRG